MFNFYNKVREAVLYCEYCVLSHIWNLVLTYQHLGLSTINCLMYLVALCPPPISISCRGEVFFISWKQWNTLRCNVSQFLFHAGLLPNYDLWVKISQREIDVMVLISEWMCNGWERGMTRVTRSCFTYCKLIDHLFPLELFKEKRCQTKQQTW